MFLGSWFWFEPRFAQESWGDLSSWFEPRFAQESWGDLGSRFWFEPRFAQESWGDLGPWFLVLVRAKICSGVLVESWSLVLGFGSNQDLLRSPGGILVLGSWFWFEPRFAQESWGDLGPWFLVLVRTKICSGVLGGSWFLVLGFGSNQDLLRSPGGILVLGSWFWFEPRFAQESWGNLGSWFLVLVQTKICSGVLGESWSLVLGFSRECILNAFFPECYH